MIVNQTVPLTSHDSRQRIRKMLFGFRAFGTFHSRGMISAGLVKNVWNCSCIRGASMFWAFICPGELLCLSLTPVSSLNAPGSCLLSWANLYQFQGGEPLMDGEFSTSITTTGIIKKSVFIRKRKKCSHHHTICVSAQLKAAGRGFLIKTWVRSSARHKSWWAESGDALATCGSLAFLFMINKNRRWHTYYKQRIIPTTMTIPAKQLIISSLSAILRQTGHSIASQTPCPGFYLTR